MASSGSSNRVPRKVKKQQKGIAKPAAGKSAAFGGKKAPPFGKKTK